MIDESVLVFNLKTNGHCVSVRDDAVNHLGSVGGSDERNAVKFVAVNVKKVDEVGHCFFPLLRFLYSTVSAFRCQVLEKIFFRFFSSRLSS